MKAKIMQKMTVTAAAARKMKTKIMEKMRVAEAAIRKMKAKIMEKMGVAEAAIRENPDVTTTRRHPDVSVQQEISLHI